MVEHLAPSWLEAGCLWTASFLNCTSKVVVLSFFLPEAEWGACSVIVHITVYKRLSSQGDDKSTRGHNSHLFAFLACLCGSTTIL